jgi:hypothetical protein
MEMWGRDIRKGYIRIADILKLAEMLLEVDKND